MTLDNTVIKNGFCVGCGACTAVKESNYSIQFDQYGKYIATSKKQTDFNVEEKLKNVCPFTSPRNETIIAQELFSEKNKFQEHIGYYQNLYAGYATNEKYRLSSSSGGILSLFIELLFHKKMIDGVLHVKRSSKNNALFCYSISNSINELRDGKKSRYYPISFNEVLKEIKGDGKKYAIVGIPCFLKAIRLLQKEEEGFKNIEYFVGIICGQLKSKYFADIFTLPYNVKSKNVNFIDFRVKLQNKSANEYAVEFKTNKKDSKLILTQPAKNIFGSDWGLGTLKYQACDACDDVFNETADIVFGDAWVPPYNIDWKGTNIVITRNRIAEKIIRELKSNKSIKIDNLSEKEILTTQDPSIRHRRVNIGYRLHKFSKEKDWVPEKRFKPTSVIDRKNKKIQDARMRFAKRSHWAMKSALRLNSSLVFIITLYPLYLRMNYLKHGLKGIIPTKIKHVIKKILSKK
ncbi:Coenzyme F420 hydrogenase/dehydrogenase, beta subunit C-terminal domain [Marinilabilia salmonicolor]|uniref:Coenzyme F420 hydrogenase/dehydrogenase, beta subunit C-terminal domain n=1 Tax=Marinilabilia salmonicolor TaxID=989 RepID=UPI00029A59CD|nr:Coenzyme F420 hydrogenase/dehydrogenase, beta subunit C-terminal domain [Marinilabilia salmonicolor]